MAAAALAGGGRHAMAQDATPATVPAVFDQWLTVWGEDPAQAGQLYAEDATIEDVPSGTVIQGLDAIREHIDAEFEGFPDHTYEVRSAFEGGGMAAMEARFVATYTGTYPGLPPGEGQPIDFRAALVIEIADGLIAREAHYYDNLTLLTQLGVLELPEGEGGESEATPEG